MLIVESDVWVVLPSFKRVYLPPVLVFTLGFLSRYPSSKPKATTGVQSPQCVVLTQGNADGLQTLTLAVHTHQHTRADYRLRSSRYTLHCQKHVDTNMWVFSKPKLSQVVHKLKKEAHNCRQCLCMLEL